MKRLPVILGAAAMTVAGLAGCSSNKLQTYKDSNGVRHTIIDYNGGKLETESFPGMSNSLVVYTDKNGKTTFEDVNNYTGRKADSKNN